MNLQQNVTAVLDEAELLPQGRLIVGVSGGPDSLALLHALTQLLPPSHLLVAHLNHALRPQAEADAAFVGHVAARWGLPLRTRRVDVAALATAQGWTLEEAGRQARYAFLAALAREVQADAVAVGHTADDQAETVLMHLLRGSGLTGLRGMLPAGPLPGAAEVVLVRPLLTTPRAAVVAYCTEHSLQPQQDNSNVDTRFLRNRVRHELLPLLESYNPQIKARLQHLADLVAGDEALLQTLVDEAWEKVKAKEGAGWLQLDRPAWRALPLSLRRRTLRRGLAQLLPPAQEISFAALEQARRVAEGPSTGTAAMLPGGVTLHATYDRLELHAQAASPPHDAPQLPGADPLRLTIPGALALAHGWRLTATVLTEVDRDALQRQPDPWRAFVDVGDASELLVRGRAAGERMQPLGLNGRSASLQDIMVNRKLPARLRGRWPLVATPQHVVWFVGVQIDRRYKVTAGTQRIVQLRCNQE